MINEILQSISDALEEKRTYENGLRRRLERLKKEGVIKYKDTAKATDISTSMVTYWVQGKKNLSEPNLVKMSSYLDSLDAEHDAEARRG